MGESRIRCLDTRWNCAFTSSEFKIQLSRTVGMHRIRSDLCRLRVLRLHFFFDRRLAQAQRRAFARRHLLLAQFFALLRSRTTLPQTCPTFSKFCELSYSPRALVPSCFPHPKFFPLMSAMADAAMAKLEKPESQEPPNAELPPQETPQATTAEPVLPAPAMVNTELSQQELEAFRAWQRQQAEEKQAAAAPSSPPQKQRTDDEEDLAEFERKLTELDINFGDLDPELQNRLRSSKSRVRERTFWPSIARTVATIRRMAPGCHNPLPRSASLEPLRDAMSLTSPQKPTCKQL